MESQAKEQLEQAAEQRTGRGNVEVHHHHYHHHHHHHHTERPADAAVAAAAAAAYPRWDEICQLVKLTVAEAMEEFHVIQHEALDKLRREARSGQRATSADDTDNDNEESVVQAAATTCTSQYLQLGSCHALGSVQSIPEAPGDALGTSSTTLHRSMSIVFFKHPPVSFETSHTDVEEEEQQQDELPAVESSSSAFSLSSSVCNVSIAAEAEAEAAAAAQLAEVLYRNPTYLKDQDSEVLEQQKTATSTGTATDTATAGPSTQKRSQSEAEEEEALERRQWRQHHINTLLLKKSSFSMAQKRR